MTTKGPHDEQHPAYGEMLKKILDANKGEPSDIDPSSPAAFDNKKEPMTHLTSLGDILDSLTEPTSPEIEINWGDGTITDVLNADEIKWDILKLEVEKPKGDIDEEGV